MEYTYSKSPMEKYPIYQLGMLLSESPYVGFLMTDLG